MQQKDIPSRDFFRGYHRARFLQYFIPGIFGILIGFGVVHLSHTGDMRGLMASVSEIAQPQYNADIVMERTDTGVRFILGKDALAVDTLSFRIMTNPIDSIVLLPSIGTLVDETEGMYHFVRSFGHQDISRGTVIVEFVNIDKNIPIAITDTELVSEGVNYHLSSKGE